MLWWTFRLMRIHQEDAAFYKKLWREECEFRDETIQRMRHKLTDITK